MTVVGRPRPSADPGPRVLAAAEAWLAAGGDPLRGEATERLVDAAVRCHPARTAHERATAAAMRACAVEGVDPAEAAATVFRRFCWTHFVCKLLMAVRPSVAVDLAAERVVLDGLLDGAGRSGPAVLTGFHFAGYPLVALAVVLSPLAPVVSKARVDVLDDQAGSRTSDDVVYVSDRSAPIRLTRALARGRSVWVLADVVVPPVRTAPTRFLGQDLRVGAGLAHIARRSARPCLPMAWSFGSRAEVKVGASVTADGGTTEPELLQRVVDEQAAFVHQHPTEWLEWHALLEASAALRAQVRDGHRQVWAALAPLTGGGRQP